jgi:hypothetical protein
MNYHLSLGDLNKYVVRRYAGSALFALTCLLMSGHLQAAGKCYKAISIDRKPLHPLCKVMEANLNEYCLEPPMVCGLKIHETYKSIFALPVWEDVTAVTSMDFLERLIKLPYLSNPDINAATNIWAEEKPSIDEAITAGRFNVWKSNLDVFQTGGRQVIYQYSTSDCELRNRFLYSTSPGAWDVPLETPFKQYLISERDFAALKQKYTIISPSGLGKGDLFSHDGKIYLYQMFGAGGRFGNKRKNLVAIDMGTINQMGNTSIAETIRVCEIQYTNPRVK